MAASNVPKEPRCAVCSEPAVKVAVDQLLGQGLSVRDIAGKVKRSKSSVHRHALHSKPADVSKRAGRRKSSQAGRCEKCGLTLDASDPTSLLRRTERILWLAEVIAAQAQADDDARLALQAVDRARAALDTLMRATGLIGGDGTTVNVAIDAKKQVLEILTRYDEATLRAIAHGAEPPSQALTT